MTKQGFTLIEVIIALFIGSLLLLSLYSILHQVQRGVILVTSVIDVDSPLMSLHNQLERDLWGAFTPLSLQKTLSQPPEDTKTPPKDDTKQDTKKEPDKAITDVFVSTQKEGRALLHFITTAGVQTLDITGDTQQGGKVAQTPALRRVVYSVEPDPARPGEFIVWYAQTQNLDPAAITNPRNLQRYELAWGIKDLTVTLKLYEPQKPPAKNTKPEQENKKAAQPAPKKLLTLTSFVPAQVQKKYRTALPAYVEIKGSVTDERRALTQPFVFLFSIPAYTLVPFSAEPEASAPPPPGNTPPPPGDGTNNVQPPSGSPPGPAGKPA